MVSDTRKDDVEPVPVTEPLLPYPQSPIAFTVTSAESLERERSESQRQERHTGRKKTWLVLQKHILAMTKSFTLDVLSQEEIPHIEIHVLRFCLFACLLVCFLYQRRRPGNISLVVSQLSREKKTPLNTALVKHTQFYEL